jgi:hypothetical protein
MTKTTNYEISKKLAEIGFRAECSYFYFHSDNNCKEKTLYNLEEFGFDKIDDCDIEDKYYPSYDLETLLDALPHNFMLEKEIKFLKMNQSGIGYETGSSPIYDYQLLCHRMKEESLADTAGRLIIKLHEKNLIKF